jgi:MoaA/NifB/PqqE/SkfB family radical SAM enzyme
MMQPQIVHTGNNFENYGRWNCLVALENGKVVEHFPAHDGDFFPESPIDYINELKRAMSLAESQADLQEVLTHTWPQRVDLDITHFCHNNCYFCYSRKYCNEHLYSNSKISLEQFDSLSAQLAKNGTKTIRFTGGGDPATHPDILKILEIPKNYNLKTCLITAGNLLNKLLVESIVDNVDHFRISLNSTTESISNLIHRPSIKGDRIGTIIKNLELLLKLRQSRNQVSSRKPSIWVTFLVLPENYHEIYHAARLMKETGVDSISFRPVYNDWAKRFSADQKSAALDQLEKIKTLHVPPGFLVFTPKRDFTKVWDINPFSHFKKCISCRLRTVMEQSNHGVLLKQCGPHRGLSGPVLGSVNNGNTLKSIWYATSTIDKMLEISSSCSRCIDISMNVTLSRVYELLKKNINTEFKKEFVPEN